MTDESLREILSRVGAVLCSLFVRDRRQLPYSAVVASGTREPSPWLFPGLIRRFLKSVYPQYGKNSIKEDLITGNISILLTKLHKSL